MLVCAMSTNAAKPLMDSSTSSLKKVNISADLFTNSEATNFTRQSWRRKGLNYVKI